MAKAVVEDFQIKVEAFDFEVNMDSRFQIVGTEVFEDGECFVVRDLKYSEDTEASHVFVPVKEVHTKPIDQIMKCLRNDRKPSVLHGVTRIVGYYSRTHNWNKSKIGELRDRQKGSYGVPSYKKEYHDEAMAVVDNLS